ncbi:MAG TPA: 2-hydroxyacid dehydrogenase, partial [Thermomicrobiales bacterium]|nr:2-hydroxyacid dehydrogenase [Thermomicrobiales bacterium]
MSSVVLAIVDLAPNVVERLGAQGIDVVLVSDHGGRAAGVAAHPDARAVVTSGTMGLPAAEIGQLPALEIICTVGAGYEGVDLDVARARGIVVTNSAGTNANAVADHAMALVMALASQIVPYHAIVTRGAWPELNPRNRANGDPDPAAGLPAKRQVSGARLGVLGMGIIGRKIADRGANGFGMEVAYHNRQPRDDAPYRWMESLEALARWADFLVCAAPGGSGTRHLVNRDVLAALGPSSYVVNIGRGSVVDTGALIDALENGTVAGAGIDVVEGEPNVPERLRASSRVVLTPHFAGRSAESAAASQELVISNLSAWFRGQPVRNRV